MYRKRLDTILLDRGNRVADRHSHQPADFRVSRSVQGPAEFQRSVLRRAGALDAEFESLPFAKAPGIGSAHDLFLVAAGVLEKEILAFFLAGSVEFPALAQDLVIAVIDDEQQLVTRTIKEDVFVIAADFPVGLGRGHAFTLPGGHGRGTVVIRNAARERTRGIVAVIQRVQGNAVGAAEVIGQIGVEAVGVLIRCPVVGDDFVQGAAAVGADFEAFLGAVKALRTRADQVIQSFALAGE